MNKMKGLFLLLMLVMATPSIASLSGTPVIAQLGPTVNAQPYLKQMMQLGADKSRAPDSDQQNSVKIPTNYVPNYVVKTDDLTPGIIQKRQVNFKNVEQPIYLVGDDEASIRWLEKYKQRLIRLQAIGFIVNVQSNDRYLALTKKLNLHPMPINGNAIAKQFDIKHYPVLISQHVVEQ